ncbi:MAG: ubiquinone/menaquinone biosynthesis methyltransferase [Dehalococcoidia bacterium]|nr:ubiquinone/menaquinone biosynthesis methyltransferase [Dehalococcoidia bacterium]
MDVLPEADQKAAVVRTMFDRIAPSYDRMNRIITLGFDQRWRRSLIDALGVDGSDTVLDLACGTGDFAVMARERGARVIGLDFAGAMLTAARRRCPEAIALVRGDALRLPLADGSVSVAVSGFALRNFVAIPPVLEELARVLRPGGRVGLLEVDEPRSGLLRLGHGVYFQRIVPAIGALLSDGSAYRYLPASAAYLPDGEGLRTMLEEAGFSSIEKRSHLGGAAQSIVAVRA